MLMIRFADMLYSFYRCQDYIWNNNFTRNLVNKILQIYLGYTDKYPSDILYSAKCSAAVNIITYFLKVYKYNAGMNKSFVKTPKRFHIL